MLLFIHTAIVSHIDTMSSGGKLFIKDILTNRSREAVLEFLVSSAETAGRLKQSGPWSPYNSVSTETSLSIEKGGNRFVVLNNKS
ncbi:MAG: hypothetical protein JRE65_07215 [Deltaproteobacteria bacterium]|nr:hypothetical protein [Deltaproteobacteria bacterium]